MWLRQETKTLILAKVGLSRTPQTVLAHIRFVRLICERLQPPSWWCLLPLAPTLVLCSSTPLLLFLAMVWANFLRLTDFENATRSCLFSGGSTPVTVFKQEFSEGFSCSVSFDLFPTFPFRGCSRLVWKFQAVLAQMLDIDVTIIIVSSVEARLQVPNSSRFSAIGYGLWMSTVRETTPELFWEQRVDFRPLSVKSELPASLADVFTFKKRVVLTEFASSADHHADGATR